MPCNYDDPRYRVDVLGFLGGVNEKWIDIFMKKHQEKSCNLNWHIYIKITN